MPQNLTLTLIFPSIEIHSKFVNSFYLGTFFYDMDKKTQSIEKSI